MEWPLAVGLAVLGLGIVALAARRRGVGPSVRRAAAFLRAQGGDLIRLPGRLRRLAADPRTPRRARWLLVALALYLANPIDLVPDFIPVLGQVDDVAVAALLLGLAWRAVPATVWAEHFPPRPRTDASAP